MVFRREHRRRFLVFWWAGWYTFIKVWQRNIGGGVGLPTAPLFDFCKEGFPMKIVVSFPGIGYHCDKPLLYYSRKLAAAAGYTESLCLQYTYHKAGLRGDPAALQEAFDTLYAQAEQQLAAVAWEKYDDILFLSKSIGTAVAAAYAQRHALCCRQVLYTPLELTFPFLPQRAIAFYGTADPWSDRDAVTRLAAQCGTPLYLYENANHSLEAGDVLRDLDTLQDVMHKTAGFVAGV